MSYWKDTDVNGLAPAVGDTVAYNWSGQVATGRITRIGRSTGRYRTGSPIYYITQTAPVRGHKSVVRGGSRCLLVLKEAT